MKKFFVIFYGVLSFYSPLFGTLVYEHIQAIPKAELHLHLGGSYPPSYLQSVATAEDFDRLEKSMDAFVAGVDYKACFSIFDVIRRTINTLERVREGTRCLCEELQRDGVTYVEIRTGLRDLGSGYEAYLRSVLDGLKAASHENFKTNLLLSLRRSSSVEMARRTIDLALKYREKGVVGIDISDNSTEGDITTILPILLEGKAKGLSFVVHMGESPQETDQMMLLEKLEPVRIGHGVHLQPEALEWIRKRKIPIEVCLSTGVGARMIARRSEHPGLRLYAEGHPIVVCTDDTLVVKTSLSAEYMYFAQATGCDMEELKKVITQSYAYCLKESLPPLV